MAARWDRILFFQMDFMMIRSHPNNWECTTARSARLTLTQASNLRKRCANCVPSPRLTRRCIETETRWDGCQSGLARGARNPSNASSSRSSLTPTAASQTCAEATNLCDISAVLHVAPLAASVSARVFKQPATFFAPTLT